MCRCVISGGGRVKGGLEERGAEREREELGRGWLDNNSYCNICTID